MEDSDTSPGRVARLRRHALGVGVVLALGGVLFAVFSFVRGDRSAAHRAKDSGPVRITLPPPPPPPPPKPPEPRPEEARKEPENPDRPMIDQEPVPAAEPPPEAPPESTPADAPMGTAIPGGDASDSGLAFSRTGGGALIGGTGTGGTGAGRAGAGRWGLFAGRVQSRVGRALAADETTRGAAVNVTARIWADAAGRVTRAVLIGSTGDAAVDAALRDRVLVGLDLGEAPPADMPMPIVMRIIGRRP